MAPFVQTVPGPVEPEGLGFTLPHEHTACQLWQIPGRWDYWELTSDEEIVAPELERFREAGGTSLADLTLPGIGRDPARLGRLSERTGLLIIMGTGWYRGAYYPPEARIDRRSVDDLAEVMIREFHDGAEGTGVRPGIIGEIGTDKPWVSAQEERVFRAAGRAARATGMAVNTHAVLSDVGLRQLAILLEERVDPSRVVIGHADSYPSLDYYLEVIERGANVEFDFIGMRFSPVEEHSEPLTLRSILRLLERGHAERILLSHDLCHTMQLKAFGGNGYTYLADVFLPRLREAGVPDEAIRQMTVENPRRILTIG